MKFLIFKNLHRMRREISPYLDFYMLQNKTFNSTNIKHKVGNFSKGQLGKFTSNVAFKTQRFLK